METAVGGGSALALFAGASISRGITSIFDRTVGDVLIMMLASLLPGQPEQLHELIMYAIFLALLLMFARDLNTFWQQGTLTEHFFGPSRHQQEGQRGGANSLGEIGGDEEQSASGPNGEEGPRRVSASNERIARVEAERKRALGVPMGSLAYSG
jgi:hypothetical protein